jgi:cardiolipin synthase
MPPRRGTAAVHAPGALRRLLAEQAFSHAAGAPLLSGNRVGLLHDGPENYPAWLEAIDAAERHVHLEMYIFRDDAVGQRFADRLAARAREGVAVCILYDWLGALGKTSGGFWQRLREAGCEVRCVNPPHFGTPLSWISRDHRKLLCVDGRVAFVSGLCIGRAWAGDPARGVEPWRDTGVRLEGPVVADAEQAFAEMWAATGPALVAEETPDRADLAPVGDQAVRLIASGPETAGLFRLDLLVASLAQRYLWLTDAYFTGHPAYLDGLRNAAAGGVDVRLLVPGASDVPVVATFSRTMYRPLLEAGVRVFEWNGPMMHAKAAVTDGRWARVGSTNLNSASWFGNWELDVAVEDEAFAKQMEAAYLRDLDHATEVALLARRRVRRSEAAARQRSLSGSANRATAAALGLGGAVGAALSRPRALGPTEATALASIGATLLFVSVLVLLLPRLLAVPFALVLGYLAVTLLARALHLRHQSFDAGTDEGDETPSLPPSR